MEKFVPSLDVDKEFFSENIVKVNKTVNKILFSTVLIPVALVIGNLVNLWEIPFKYCITMLSFSIITSVISFYLNKKEKHQIFSMYFGICAASIFVAIMAYSGLVRLSISYAFGTIISCLYYNRPLTITTTVLNFLLSIWLSWVQSYTNINVVIGKFGRIQFFVQMIIGLAIEFVFLLFISAAIARRTEKTMRKLVSTLSDREMAFDRLKSQNGLITDINNALELKNNELNETQYKIIRFVAECLGSHDLFTGRHVMHTQKYVEVICSQLIQDGFYTEELTERNIHYFSTAAFLHDIGKIHIPEGVLNKIGKFTPEEFELMKCHPEEGKKLLEYLPPIENGVFNSIAKDMTYCHHEKWDGTGYPNGISGEQIPLSARIMAAADVLDALISQRLYKDPMSVEEAMEVFKKNRGSHFEPCIADAVIKSRFLIELIDTDFKTREASSNAEELEWWYRYHDSQNKSK